MPKTEDTEQRRIEHRIRCIQMHKDGKTNAQIVHALGRPRQWIYKWKTKAFSDVYSTKQSGRPRILTKRQINIIKNSRHKKRG